VARDPILSGILEIRKLPVQSTFWRFLAALHLNVLPRQTIARSGASDERSDPVRKNHQPLVPLPAITLAAWDGLEYGTPSTSNRPSASST
jgi:hypothetical protein